jgi:S-DNA-T family DNA segregation ATPase FtsK/SpoIIIE
VDYQQFLKLPHLREGIITEQGRAQEVLASLVQQMDQRYDLLFKAGVNNLLDYNKKVPISERLPILWLVHDEFADWMLVNEYKDAISASVQRLGTKARAAGIHLVFAAQRPDANVLPPQLRDNLGNRLILRVESQGTSEIALNEKGAEKLLGRGHLAARLNGEIIYAQVPFLSYEEQLQVVEEIRKHDNEQ